MYYYIVSLIFDIIFYIQNHGPTKFQYNNNCVQNMKKIIYKSRMRKWYYFVLFLIIPITFIELYILYVLSIMIYYYNKWISKQRQHIVFRNLQFMDVPTVLRHFLYNICVSFTIRLSSSKHFQRNDQKIHWNCCYLSLKNLYSVFKNLLFFFFFKFNL